MFRILKSGNTPDTIVQDEYIQDGPKNADGTYMGSITLRTAVSLSRNTVAWNVLKELTPKSWKFISSQSGIS